MRLVGASVSRYGKADAANLAVGPAGSGHVAIAQERITVSLGNDGFGEYIS